MVLLLLKPDFNKQMIEILVNHALILAKLVIMKVLIIFLMEIVLLVDMEQKGENLILHLDVTEEEDGGLVLEDIVNVKMDSMNWAKNVSLVYILVLLVPQNRLVQVITVVIRKILDFIKVETLV